MFIKAIIHTDTILLHYTHYLTHSNCKPRDNHFQVSLRIRKVRKSLRRKSNRRESGIIADHPENTPQNKEINALIQNHKITLTIKLNSSFFRTTLLLPLLVFLLYSTFSSVSTACKRHKVHLFSFPTVSSVCKCFFISFLSRKKNTLEWKLRTMVARVLFVLFIHCSYYSSQVSWFIFSSHPPLDHRRLTKLGTFYSTYLLYIPRTLHMVGTSNIDQSFVVKTRVYGLNFKMLLLLVCFDVFTDSVPIHLWLKVVN